MQHLSCEVELSQCRKTWKWDELRVIRSGNVFREAARKSNNHSWSNGS